jgi:hypothetical protein
MTRPLLARTAAHATAEAIRAEGTAWFGNATWNGQRVMRVSVTGWSTTEQDVERTIAAVERVLSSTH